MQTKIAASSDTLHRRWPADNYLFLLACLLCSLPVWLPHLPPMVDLPQHAAQISLYLNMGKADFPFSEQFQVNWFTPYLLGYALIALATPLLGIVAACKLVVWLALAGFALSTRFLLRQTGADPYWAWLTFPVLYGFTYQWGLLNFLVAAPIGMVFLGLVWKQQARPDWRASLLNAVLLYLLFFSHALIMALFSMIAAAYWLASAPRLRDLIKCAWPMLALAPAVLVWLFLASKHPVTNAPVEWDLSWINTSDGYYDYFAHWTNRNEPGWGRVTGFIPRLLGVRPEIVFTLLGIALFALPFLAGGRITRSRARWLPLLCIVLLLLLLPSFLFGNVYTFQRFTFLAMPLFLVVMDAGKSMSRAQRTLRMIAPVVAFGWVAFMANNALQFNKDGAGFEDILSKMEPGKRALSLVFETDDSHSIAPTFLHFPAWYSARRSGVSDPSFAENYAQPVVYKPEYVPKARFQGFVWNPQWFDWQGYDGYKYDYFVVRAAVDASDYLFRTAACGISLEAHSGQWWLYRRDSNCRN